MSRYFSDRVEQVYLYCFLCGEGEGALFSSEREY